MLHWPSHRACIYPCKHPPDGMLSSASMQSLRRSSNSIIGSAMASKDEHLGKGGSCMLLLASARAMHLAIRHNVLSRGARTLKRRPSSRGRTGTAWPACGQVHDALNTSQAASAFKTQMQPAAVVFACASFKLRCSSVRGHHLTAYAHMTCIRPT